MRPYRRQPQSQERPHRLDQRPAPLTPGRIIGFDAAGGGYNLITEWGEVMAAHGADLDTHDDDVPYGFCVGRQQT